MFESFVAWFAGTQFYIRYVSQWPAPLNSVSFDAFILLIFLIYGAWQAYNGIQSMRFHQRLRHRQKQIEGRYLKEEEISIDRLLDQYMKFLIVAQMKDMRSLEGLSFEEFVVMKAKAEKKAGQTEVLHGAGDDAEDLSTDIHESRQGEKPMSQFMETVDEDGAASDDSRDLTDINESRQGGKPVSQFVDPVETELVDGFEDEGPETMGDAVERESGLGWSYEDDDSEEIGAAMTEVVGEIFGDAPDEEPIDYEDLEQAKAMEPKTTDRDSDFYEILNSLEYRDMQDKAIAQKEERKAREAADRMQSLDRDISGRIRVEGELIKEADSKADALVEEDFNRRKEQALKQEAKEERKREKAEQKAEAERLKQEEKESKRAKRRKSHE